jgi:uncharacterized HAD superfamily protein
MKRICIDIDGTICTLTDGKYEEAQPYKERIEYINELHDEGAEIIYWTARGGNSGKDHTELTKSQLEQWGAKYTELRLDKMPFDYLIDDKAYNTNKFFQGGYFDDFS